MMKDFDTVARLVQCSTAFFTALRNQDLQTLYSLIATLLAPKTADAVTSPALDPSEDSDQEFDDAAGEFRPKPKSQDNLAADDLDLYFALSYTSSKVGEYLFILEDSGSGMLLCCSAFHCVPSNLSFVFRFVVQFCSRWLAATSFYTPVPCTNLAFDVAAIFWSWRSSSSGATRQAHPWARLEEAVEHHGFGFRSRSHVRRFGSSPAIGNFLSVRFGSPETD